MALITRENAAEMARRGALARKARKLRAVPIDFEPVTTDEFRRLRLARVRVQLSAMDKLMDKEIAAKEPDATRIDKLASALIRMNEQERQLSNRSLPPTLKASPVPKRTGPLPPQFHEPEPEPAPSDSSPGDTGDSLGQS